MCVCGLIVHDSSVHDVFKEKKGLSLVNTSHYGRKMVVSGISLSEKSLGKNKNTHSC